MKYNVALLLMCVFLPQSCVGDSPSNKDVEIVDEIGTEVRPDGGTARLNCTVANQQHHVVIWEHLDADQVIRFNEIIDLPHNPIEDGKRKYEVQKTIGPENHVTYTLIIRRLTQQDAGHFRCHIRLQALAWEHWPSKTGSLIVQGSSSTKQQHD